ncbi:MAG TPA: phosphonate C-P lyase system protein PhnH, partial [Candidatus Microbacterium pullistercoris]|nr:phosphonate C-P lyase system protein PhnH [Candidatus Microbacterium pullistercoris]
ALPTGDIVATGPGIDGSIAWDGAGASARFLEARRANIAMFPRGIDAILAARGSVTGLPRTTVTTQKEKA